MLFSFHAYFAPPLPPPRFNTNRFPPSDVDRSRHHGERKCRIQRAENKCVSRCLVNRNRCGRHVDATVSLGNHYTAASLITPLAPIVPIVAIQSSRSRRTRTSLVALAYLICAGAKPLSSSSQKFPLSSSPSPFPPLPYRWKLANRF